MHSSAAADLQQTDSYFVVAHIHYVLFGGVIFALFSGIYYWFPKITGKLLSEGIGKAHFWVMLLAFNLTFFPQHYLGLHGMPRRTFTYQEGLGFEAMNLMSTAGSLILGFSILIFLWNVFHSLRKGERAGRDPWGGATLEWAIDSPPPHYNFRVEPTVHSRDPLWAEGGLDVNVNDPTAPEPHMPSPSWWPLILSVGLVTAAAGAVAKSLPVVLAGAAIVVVSIYGWAFQPLER